MLRELSSFRVDGRDHMLRVLAVDDDPQILQLLSLTLGLDGFDVATANNGGEALESIAEEIPDVVLLDIMMPVLDGWQVCERLKADEATRDLPVVFLSARSQHADRARGMELGARAFMTKPFDPTELHMLLEGIALGAA
jgi:CheY-like chemotaxis protein